ncbi:hypothetical protein HMPREF1982_04494 [Clostridiales bacterium oral taxon 876 str. F0540]|nr:hypothetical protein HMPREF1982_04494 [Clostridiales bacterium oral taxon 876 str. F0540]
MKIKRLYIRNYGIYRNELIENISSKIVVIGGINRSGKTTLLEILRNMPYGFSKGQRGLKEDYYVEADLESFSKENYIMRVEGFREPKITETLTGRDAYIKELYGNVDRFTYSQLYTITLDELRKSNIKAEEEKLQAVLLGAGLSDIVHIPKIMEELKKEKEKIGGKLGNPNTKLFKNYYERIVEGAIQREAALEELDEYISKTKELEQLEIKIEDEENIHMKNKQKLLVIETIKAYYDQYIEKTEAQKELENIKLNDLKYYEELPSLDRLEALQEEYMLSYKAFNDAKNNFSRISEGSDSNLYNVLIKHKRDIKETMKKISGLEEKTDNYYSLSSSFQRKKEDMLLRMNSINEGWYGDFVTVLNINCDFIEQDKLISLIEALKQLEDKKNKIQWDKDNITLQKKNINLDVKKTKSEDLGIFIRNYLYTSLGIFFAGVILTFFNKTLGSILALSGVLTAALYFFIKYASSKNGRDKSGDLSIQFDSLSSKEKVLEQELEGINSSLEDHNKKLQAYKDMLSIDKAISPLGILQYFKEVQSLKKEITALGYEGKRLDKEKEDLRRELEKIIILLERISDCRFYNEKFVEKQAFLIFDEVKLKAQQLEYAEQVENEESKLINLENKIRKVLKLEENKEELVNMLDKIIEQYKMYSYYEALNKKVDLVDKQIIQSMSSESVRQAFSFQCNAEIFVSNDIINCFRTAFSDYTSKEHLNREYTELINRLEDDANALEDLKEKKQSLKIELQNLASSSKLEKAQDTIDEGREKLKQLAVKFSVYSAAEYILENVQHNFIRNAKDTLLTGASCIFQRITSDEYKTVIPGENLLQTDYKVLKDNGEVQDSSYMLSRGTAEQLFLSVRLNRIMSMEPKLPIILDEPFVNFDSRHTKNTMQILSKLSEENQIIILTCHGKIVELLSKVTNDIQYFNLENGKLTLCSDVELIGKLSEDRK